MYVYNVLYDRGYDGILWWCNGTQRKSGWHNYGSAVESSITNNGGAPHLCHLCLLVYELH